MWEKPAHLESRGRKTTSCVNVREDFLVTRLLYLLDPGLSVNGYESFRGFVGGVTPGRAGGRAGRQGSRSTTYKGERVFTAVHLPRRHTSERLCRAKRSRYSEDPVISTPGVYSRSGLQKFMKHSLSLELN